MVALRNSDLGKTLQLQSRLISSEKDIPGQQGNHTRYEPPHDKTNKMTVRPAKTQISLGIRPVRSESSLSA